MKKLLVFLVLLTFGNAFAVSDLTLRKSYGAHTTACTATAVASTNDNRSGPYPVVNGSGLYLVYGYTSANDFTGVAIKCLQGDSSVTVDSVEGVKISSGEKQIWTFSNNYISCQTGSGSGYYDVCLME